MRSASRFGSIAVTLLFVLALAPRLFAQGWIDPPRPTPQWGVQKIRSAVSVAVSGRVARVSVEEWFRNNGPALGEGIYHYPLPGEAVFSEFSLWQGDQELKGETMDAAQARSIYEEIVRRRRDPALIELAGHGLIRARVFPINPGETRKITLRYTQLLDRVGDAWRLRYATGTGPGASNVARSFQVTADSADRFGDPYSPTHQLHTHRVDGGRLQVTLDDSSASSDLQLFLPLARGLVGMSLLGHGATGEDGYFMLLLAPGQASDAAPVHRDLVAVLDVSGSMSGDKLNQAKAALQQLLGTLSSGDRFRVIAFASGVRRFAAEWTQATAEDRRRAADWIRGLDTDGGTNIAGALDDAFSMPPAEGSLGVVVFLTDGLPTVGEQDPERIASRAESARGAYRVFSFGIGYDVNTYLLDHLTERARGVTEYIAPGGDIERPVATLAAKIASPVLTDLAISADGGTELYDLQPQTLPDLFAGDEMVVLGRYRGGPNAGVVTVRGRRGGSEQRFQTNLPRTAETNDYIPRLWASRKAGALSQEIRLHGQTPELLSALKDLALRYGILTEYTSYLVQEPDLALNHQLRDRAYMPAPFAPRDQAGAGAVAQSKAEATLRQATVDASPALEMRGQAGINPMQRVGARLFILRDSVWTDLQHDSTQRVVRVAPFSDAYFALLRALPELVRPAGMTPAVLVAGRRVSIEIEAGGLQSWGDGELEAVVREFRS
jgi:Ca-activated chloride channel family protein